MSVIVSLLLPQANQSATADDPLKSDAVVLDEIFGVLALAENVREIRIRAAAMPPQQRFDFLLRSVLTESGAIRMAGEFTQTDPAPLHHDALPPHPSAGGKLVSPVYDLLDVARDLGRLADLRDRVEELSTTGDEFAAAFEGRIAAARQS